MFNGDGPATDGVAGVPVVVAAGVVTGGVTSAVGLNGVNAIPVRSSAMNLDKVQFVDMEFYACIARPEWCC